MAADSPDLQDLIQRIKDRVEIEAVIGRRVRLERRGRRLVGLCPFHPEKTPSFTVSPQAGFFKCFGCGKGGDVITFVRESEGVEFWEALRTLADEAGVELPARSGAPAGPSRDLREAMREALAQARRLYHAALAEPGGRPARDYLEARGVAAETIESFALGWAPPEPAWLHGRLRRSGIPDSALVAAGLVVPAEGGRSPRDRFWDRLIFPVADAGGRTVGFGARYLPGSRAEAKGLGKYVNSPEGPLFPKRRLLYGLDRLPAALRDHPDAPVYLCEGFLDVILLQQAGWPTTVAALGTAITEDHARRLRRLDRPVALVLDPDRAGREAAVRAGRILVDEGVDVRVVELPDGQDPADLVTSGQLEELAQRLAGMRDILEWRLESWLRREDFGVPAVQARAAREMAAWVSTAADPVVAERWASRACDALGISEASLRHLVRRPLHVSPGPLPDAPSTESTPAGASAREILARNEQELVAALVRDPSLWARHRDELTSLHCLDSSAEKVLNWCRERRNKGLPFDLGLALEAFAGDTALAFLDRIRLLPVEQPDRVLEGALRTLPQNREWLQREERRRRGSPPSDEDLARWQRRVDLSPRPGGAESDRSPSIDEPT